MLINASHRIVNVATARPRIHADGIFIIFTAEWSKIVETDCVIYYQLGTQWTLSSVSFDDSGVMPKEADMLEYFYKTLNPHRPPPILGSTPFAPC